jgi:hypothetical protein
MAYGERQPKDGEPGMTMTMYIHGEELAKLDRLKDAWGLKRNAALRRVLREAPEPE